MIHKLKTVEPFFFDIHRGLKTFEIRKDDRPFSAGDILHLQKWPELGGAEIQEVEVIYIMRDAPDFGLMPGYCLMGIRLLRWRKEA